VALGDQLGGAAAYRENSRISSARSAAWLSGGGSSASYGGGRGGISWPLAASRSWRAAWRLIVGGGGINSRHIIGVAAISAASAHHLWQHRGA